MNFSIMSIALGVALSASAVLAQPGYDDGHGREWRQLTATTGLTWQQVAQVCPTDGSGPCSGTVGGRDLTGWRWASAADVRDLFSYSVPQILQTPNLSGPAYFVSALFFIEGNFTPTFSFYIETANYEFVGGWTSTVNTDDTVIIAAVSASWPVFNGSWTTASSFGDNIAQPYTGVWLWRWIEEPCPADFDGDGFITGLDFDAYAAAFEAGNASSDFDNDGFVTGLDFDAFVRAFEEGC